MNTYAAYENGKQIISRAPYKQIKEKTGVSYSMLVKCIDTGCLYKKIFTFEIDGDTGPAKQTGRYIYNEDGKRIKLPLDLETEWNELMASARRKLEKRAERQVG